jgi:hypothetical protein
MKKFLVVCWDYYYPDSGLLNIRGSYDTIEEAMIAKDDHCSFDVRQIIDRDSLDLLWERRKKRY